MNFIEVLGGRRFIISMPVAAVMSISIDMTAATGKLLLSHAGFDVLSISR